MSRGPEPMPPPDGAIAIHPGESLQEAINVSVGGATFWLRAGVHPWHGAVVPRAGNAFVGEYGAILDGTGWVTSDIDAAAFKALNVDVDDVLIRNLQIRQMPQKGIMAYRDFSSGWIVDRCEIHRCKNGLELGSGKVSNSIIHHCIGTTGHPNPAERGGGYTFNTVSNILFSNNEVYENGSEQKWILCTGIRCAGNYFHHGAYAGAWIDGGGADSILEDNICEDHIGPGIVVEVANGVIVRRNASRRSQKESGVLIAISQGIEVYENLLEHNAFGIDLFLDFHRLLEHYDGHPDPDLANNLIRQNTVVVLPGQRAAVFTHINGTIGQVPPYVTNAKNNRFVGNSYTVPDAGAYWIWANDPKTFPDWQAIPQDAEGPTQPPDPIPPEPQPIPPTCTLNNDIYAQGATTEVTVKRDQVSTWTGDHPEWRVMSTKPHPKKKNHVILTVECQP